MRPSRHPNVPSRIQLVFLVVVVFVVAAASLLSSLLFAVILVVAGLCCLLSSLLLWLIPKVAASYYRVEWIRKHQRFSLLTMLGERQVSKVYLTSNMGET